MKKIHKNQLLFILIVLFGGILVGVIGSTFLEMENLNQLDVILLPMNDAFDLYPTFLFQFALQMLYIIGIVILGTSILGTFLIAFLLFTKGFQIGLTCMMFIYTYELKGLLGIVLTLLPQVALEMIPIVIIAIYSIESSNHILYSCLNLHKLKLTSEVNKGLNYLLLSIASVFVASYLKSTLIIMLIRFFNQF